MSEQEMIKYKNKYKVWAILHPNVFRGCKECKYINRNCGNKDILTLMYDKNTDEITFSNEPQDESKVCIEWIKHV